MNPCARKNSQMFALVVTLTDRASVVQQFYIACNFGWQGSVIAGCKILLPPVANQCSSILAQVSKEVTYMNAPVCFNITQFSFPHPTTPKEPNTVGARYSAGNGTVAHHTVSLRDPV